MRFQEYVDDWSNPGNTEGDLYPLDKINLPVSMFVGQGDGICDYTVAAMESTKISSLQNFYSIKNGGHSFPVSNKADFVDLLKKEVTATRLSSPNREEIELESVTEKWMDWDQEGWEKFVEEHCDGDEESTECFYAYLESLEGGKGSINWMELRAQFTFLSLASSLAFYSAMQLFRY